MSEFVDFVVSGHTAYSAAEFAILDATVNITILLHDMQLIYENDWRIDSSFFNQKGQKVIRIEFFNAKDAMLAKLNGLANG